MTEKFQVSKLSGPIVNQSAWNKFLTEIHPTVKAEANSVLPKGMFQDWPDVEQATALSLFRGRANLASKGEIPRAFARKVARRRALDLIESVNGEVVVDFTEDGKNGGPELPVARDIAEDVTNRILLEHALSGLPRRQRSVLELIFLEDLKPGKVAKVLGIEPRDVEVQKELALKKLREEFNVKGPDRE